MLWSLKASKKMKGSEQTLLEWVQNLEDDGHDTTGMLEEEPELFPDLHAHWNAFQILSSSRNTGMSIGAIPLPAYESYFRIFCIDSLEEQLEYLKFVGILDKIYLRWQGEESEKERKKNEHKSKAKGHKA